MSRISDLILSLRGWVALLVVFLLPALEASVFFGFLFPGEVAVILGGVLACQHRITLAAAIAVAVSGAIVGDTVGYAVGRRWGRPLLQGALGRVVKAHHLDQAERFLANHGGKAVFLGRWTAALRVLIPGLAGMSRLRYRTFAIWNVLGGGLWAITFVLVGYAAGEGWRTVEALAKQASLVLLLVVILGVGVVLLARWLSRHPERIRATLDRQLERPAVTRLRARAHQQLAWLAGRLRPSGALGLALTLGLAAIGLVGWAVGVVLQVLAHHQLLHVDELVQRIFSGPGTPWLTATLGAAAGLGGAGLLLALGVAAGLTFRLMPGGRWQPLWLLLACYGGAELLALIVQALVRRPRPSSMVVPASGYSFPSREATAAAGIYGLLAVLAAARTSRWSLRVAAWTTALAGLGLLAVAQLYVGTNWLSDVLGGWALGGLWLVVLLMVVRTLTGWHPSPSSTPASGQIPDAKA
jgi:membrane protein DedA with SNARE-associated domain/membrane-associated phospholipid phosphatase